MVRQRKNCLKGIMAYDIDKKIEYDNDPGGLLTMQSDPSQPTYNFKLLSEYCRKTGRRPIELSNEEREQFRTN